eukprot:178275_1
MGNFIRKVDNSSESDYDELHDETNQCKFAISYEINGTDWDEYRRMLGSLKWKGDIPQSFNFDQAKDDRFHQLIIAIKQTTRNCPSKIRTKQTLIKKIQNTTFYGKNENQQFLMKHLDMSPEETQLQNINCKSKVQMAKITDSVLLVQHNDINSENEKYISCCCFTIKKTI